MASAWRRRQMCIIILLSGACCLVLLTQVSNQVFVSIAPPNVPTIFVLTPTYSRPTQIADMTRLCNTLMHVPSLFWIVVEDAVNVTESLKELLEFCAIPHVHLAKRTPKNFTGGGFGRGVTNRNEGLRWLRENVHSIISDNGTAVLYFADDDNAFDIRLFEEIRQTKPDRVSMFPVGAILTTGLSSPIIHKNGSLIGYFDPYPAKRKYIVDMAGFAVGMNLFLRSNAKFVHKTGALEDEFLQGLKFNDNDIQFLAKGCTRILVWHVKTTGGPYMKIEKLDSKFTPFVNATNLNELVKLYSSHDS